jgi:hypothetical protein
MGFPGSADTWNSLSKFSTKESIVLLGVAQTPMVSWARHSQLTGTRANIAPAAYRLREDTTQPPQHSC